MSIALAQSSFEHNFRRFTSFFNGVIRESFTESEEKEVIDQLFATTVCIGNAEVGIAQWKGLLEGFLQAGRKCEILHFEFLDDSHVKYQTHITGPNTFESTMDHAIATMDKNSHKIVSIEPLDKDETARILFELKFREYLTLYDGKPKVLKEEEDVFLKNFFDEDFHVTIDNQEYNLQQWMEAVKTCMMEGMKVYVLKFSFLPNSTSTFVYKLRVYKNMNAKDEVVLLSVGKVKNGRFASFTPSSDKNYRLVFPSPVDRKNDFDKENAMMNDRPSTRRKRVHRPSGYRFGAIERALL